MAAGTLTECSTGGDKRVCDGAVTKTLKSSTPSVQVCDMGKLKVKNVQQVGKGAPTPGGGQRHNCCIFNIALSQHHNLLSRMRMVWSALLFW